jgi:glutaredoxin 3
MSANGSGDNAVADTVKQLINDHKVIVFSKTYCPYCVKAKDILGKYKLKDYKVIELDEIDNGDEYQKVLGKMTNARTVPRVFIAGQCIGGGDDTERLDKKGDLEKQLKQVGAIEN